MASDALAITYVDSALLQFAGEVGMMSLGLEKNLSRYSIGGLYGVVPAEVSGGKVIETIALRQTYRFTSWKRLDFYGGLNVFHVLGIDYQTEKFRDAPKGYYSIGSIRGILNLGINVEMGPREDRAFYFEAGMNDIWITNYLSQSREVNPRDHVSLAMGFKKKF